MKNTFCYWLALCSSMVLVSCNSGEPQHKVTAAQHNNSPQRPHAPRHTHISHSDFSNTPFCAELTAHTLPQRFTKGYELIKTPIQNRYDDLTDTLYAVKKPGSVVLFYKTKDKFLLDSLDITSSYFTTLCYGIQVGMSKQAFIKALSADGAATEYADTIQIENDEGEHEFHAYFQKSRLMRLHLRSSLD